MTLIYYWSTTRRLYKWEILEIYVHEDVYKIQMRSWLNKVYQSVREDLKGTIKSLISYSLKT